MTGVGESTVICIVNEVSQAIVENLWTKFVSNLFPKNQGDFSNVMEEMDSEWQFPFAFSAIDRSHFPMKCPPGGPSNETVSQLQKLLFHHPTWLG